MNQTSYVEQARAFFQTFGIDLDQCSEEIRKLLIDYFLNGPEEAIRTLLLNLKEEQLAKSN